jgi:hypothetical protein
MSDYSSDEENSENKPFCTICYHPLDHPLYDIKFHPVLNTSTCCICFDELIKLREAISFEADSDICSWCFQDDCGTLFICDNEPNCPHHFCKSCISNNFDSTTLKKIEKSSSWKCFVCNPNQLKDLYISVKKAEEQSLFKVLLGSKTLENLSEEELIRYLYTLCTFVIEEKNEQSLKVEEILSSYEKQLSSSSSTLQDLQQQWKRHFDILEIQEGYLTDLLIDLKQSHLLVELHRETMSSIVRTNSIPPNSIDSSSSTAAAAGGAIDLEERVVKVEEEEKNQNEKMDEDDNNDLHELLKEYNHRPDLQLSSLPGEFVDTVSPEVLKALYYCTR